MTGENQKWKISRWNGDSALRASNVHCIINEDKWDYRSRSGGTQ